MLARGKTMENNGSYQISSFQPVGWGDDRKIVPVRNFKKQISARAT